MKKLKKVFEYTSYPLMAQLTGLLNTVIIFIWQRGTVRTGSMVSMEPMDFWHHSTKPANIANFITTSTIAEPVDWNPKDAPVA